jgi:hypothetical protein
MMLRPKVTKLWDMRATAVAYQSQNKLITPSATSSAGTLALQSRLPRTRLLTKRMARYDYTPITL